MIKQVEKRKRDEDEEHKVISTEKEDTTSNGIKNDKKFRESTQPKPASTTSVFSYISKREIDDKTRNSIYKPESQILAHFENIKIILNGDFFVDGEFFIIMKSGKYYLRYAPLDIKPTLEATVKHLFNKVTINEDVNNYHMECCINDISKIRTNSNILFKNEVMTFIPLKDLPFLIPQYTLTKEEFNSFISVLSKLVFVKNDQFDYFITVSSLPKQATNALHDVEQYMQNINSNPDIHERVKKWKEQRLNNITDPTYIKTDLSKPIKKGFFASLKPQDVDILDEQIRTQLLLSGVDDNERWEAWKYMLGIHKFKSTEQIRLSRTEKYKKLNIIHESIFDDALSHWKQLNSTFDQIKKDVVRVDYSKLTKWNNPQSILNKVLRLYVLYNYDLSYVQGMHDIALGLMEYATNEEELFWVFTEVMKIVIHDFECPHSNEFDNRMLPIITHVDKELGLYLKENGISLYFIYRWVALLFKRDFPRLDCLKLWDAIFAYPEHKLQYFITAVIIQQHRDHILANHLLFDDVSMFFQSLSGLFSVDVVYLADMLYYNFFKGSTTDTNVNTC
ncbi:Rab-GAP TBC domain-containing protein [Entamoeba marina]